MPKACGERLDLKVDTSVRLLASETAELTQHSIVSGGKICGPDVTVPQVDGSVQWILENDERDPPQ